VPFLLPK